MYRMEELFFYKNGMCLLMFAPSRSIDHQKWSIRIIRKITKTKILSVRHSNPSRRATCCAHQPFALSHDWIWSETVQQQQLSVSTKPEIVEQFARRSTSHTAAKGGRAPHRWRCLPRKMWRTPQRVRGNIIRTRPNSGNREHSAEYGNMHHEWM